MNPQPAAAPSHEPKPIELAKRQTEKIQQKLQVAGAELHLTNTALARNLPHGAQAVEVTRALVQNIAIEEKVDDAAHDLQLVTGLLKKEVAQRQRLERELASQRPAA